MSSLTTHIGKNLQNLVFRLVFEANDDVETLDAFFRQSPEAVAAAMQDYGAKETGPLSTSNLTKMAQLSLSEFHTEAGYKELNRLLAEPNTRGSRTATVAFTAAHETFVRSVLTESSGAIGNYVFGESYAPFEGPSPDYRAPGKHISFAIELSHPLSRGSVQ